MKRITVLLTFLIFTIVSLSNASAQDRNEPVKNNDAVASQDGQVNTKIPGDEEKLPAASIPEPKKNNYLQPLAMICGAIIAFIGVIISRLIDIWDSKNQRREKFRELAFNRVLDSLETLEAFVIALRTGKTLSEDEVWIFTAACTSVPDDIRELGYEVISTLNDSSKAISGNSQLSALHESIIDYRQKLIPEMTT